MGDASSEAAWHAREAGDVFESLESDPTGLSSEEAAVRRTTVGPNRLPAPRPVPAWRIFLRQFRNPLIYVLAAAAIVSFGIGEETDAVFIAGVLVVNALVGGVQEWRAERSSQALQQLIRTRATAVRDGETQDVDGEDVVPGDVVLLESGYRVPADVRLLSTHGLEVDESALTGESAPVLKDEDWTGEPAAALGDRRNMAYAGTVVNRGRARGVVVETGAETVVGRLAADVTSVEGGHPPLVVRMERFTRIVGLVVLVAAAITALLGLAVQQYDAVEMFLFAVALAVSAIPEGLPVGITVALGVASRRMAKVGVIVRRLVAVEGLGSCTMIASDKTGTLTANELTVTQLRLPNGSEYEVTGEGYAPEGDVRQDGTPPAPGTADDLSRLARAAVLCNEGHLARREDEWTWRGDPTDVALLSFGRKLGWARPAALRRYPQTTQIPFEPEQRYAATYHRLDPDADPDTMASAGSDADVDPDARSDADADGHSNIDAAKHPSEPPPGETANGGLPGDGALGERDLAVDDGAYHVFVKGAPERVLEMCSSASQGQFDPDRLARDATALAQDGYRVLAVADGVVDEEAMADGQPPEPSDLTFLGFLGLIDPLRSGVTEAVAAAQKAGITVTMITGDHPETALAIARRLGLADAPDEVTTGAELTAAGGDDLQSIIESTRVFARVSPGQKLDIVEAARELGHYVAVTGDGVNDAPALRQANIGIAMGQMGTDVARDAAELVISDDNFATIVAGIEQGRVAFDNIRKVIFLLISTGAGEVVLVLLSLAAGLPLPLLPVQILWLNLVTNGIQDVALAFEPKEGDVLDRPPRSPNERVFNRIMIERTVVAALVIGVLGFATFAWFLEQGFSEADARNHLLLLVVLFEVVNIGNARSETASLFELSPLRSPILLTGTILAFAIHVAAMYLPVGQAVLGTAPVDPLQWLVLGAIALAIAVAMELHKYSWRARYPPGAERETVTPTDPPAE